MNILNEFHTATQGVPLTCRFAVAPLPPERKTPLEFGVVPSPLGPLLTVWLHDWLCRLDFAPQDVPARMARLYPNWSLKENIERGRELMPHVFSGHAAAPLRLLLAGTPFQCAVWRALLDIPKGATISYGELARQAGYPQAARAVGTAMAQNPIVFLAPCHRVIRAGGQTGNYGGGADLKTRLLHWERTSAPNAAMPPFFQSSFT